MASVEELVQQPVARLPWGHVTVLPTRLEETVVRDRYAVRAVEHGWSRAVMEHQVMGALHTRTGAAPSNFTAHLPAPGSELAQQLTRDPCTLDLFFFHVEQLRYVVIVDERMRRPAHAPTVGVLLCTGRDEAIVRYALAGAGAPVAVATYDTLPLDQRAGLPDPDELTAATPQTNSTASDDPSLLGLGVQPWLGPGH